MSNNIKLKLILLSVISILIYYIPQSILKSTALIPDTAKYEVTFSIISILLILFIFSLFIIFITDINKKL